MPRTGVVITDGNNLHAKPGGKKVVDQLAKDDRLWVLEEVQHRKKWLMVQPWRQGGQGCGACQTFDWTRSIFGWRCWRWPRPWWRRPGRPSKAGKEPNNRANCHSGDASTDSHCVLGRNSNPHSRRPGPSL